MTTPLPKEIATFLASIRAYFANPDRIHGDRVTVLGTAAVDDDRAAVVIYREYDAGPTLGLHVDLQSFRRRFDPITDARRLAEIVAADEIADPSGGSGATMRVSWADGLVPNPAEVRWRIL